MVNQTATQTVRVSKQVLVAQPELQAPRGPGVRNAQPEKSVGESKP